jgi:hypothetical protein
VRDRRWDFLYDRERQPVKEYLLERFAEQLAGQLRAWPPPFEEFVSVPLMKRWAEGLERRPPDEVLRLSLELARLDLGRETEAYEERMRNAEPRTCRGEADRAALQLLAVLVVEECLELKERAEGARLGRPDLVRAIERVERHLFGGTPG